MTFAPFFLFPRIFLKTKFLLDPVMLSSLTAIAVITWAGLNTRFSYVPALHSVCVTPDAFCRVLYSWLHIARIRNMNYSVILWFWPTSTVDKAEFDALELQQLFSLLHAHFNNSHSLSPTVISRNSHT